jgi:hypothetical protein
VYGGPGQAQGPIPNIEIRAIPANSTDLSGGVSVTTNARGLAKLTIPGGGPQKVVYTINGHAETSKPFDVTKSGGKMLIRANWEDAGKLFALFDVPSATGKVVYAEAVKQGQLYRSIPSQLLEAAGTKGSLYFYPRNVLRFRLQAFVEDQLFAAQGRLAIENYSWAPYRAGDDGLLIPLPHGFKGGVVFGNDQSEVSVVAGEGFRIMRPIPPGGRQFNGGFSLDTKDGTVEWSLDLPIGTYQSELWVKKTAGLKVQLPAGVRSQDQELEQGGKFLAIGPIGIERGQSMKMTFEGLPTEPVWRRVVPRLVGGLVIAMLAAGVFFAMFRGKARGQAPSNEARRQALLDQLVELERKGGNPKRREQLIGELEQIWR